MLIMMTLNNNKVIKGDILTIINGINQRKVNREQIFYIISILSYGSLIYLDGQQIYHEF